MRINLYPPQAIYELGQRSNQEDFIYPRLGEAGPDDRLFIVCDGMGGHEHGEVASSTFATALADYFKSRVSPELPLADEALADAIATAYKALDAVDDGSFKKMGTTLTMIYLHSRGVTAAHIGDSRIYHCRPGVGLLYVSRDHSLVFDLYQSGEITYDEMKTSPQRNIITRAVQPGEDNRVRPDVIHITDVQPGDYFVLCSDGILEQIEDDQLEGLLASDATDAEKCQQLTTATIGNKDNHSAYIVHVESVTPGQGDNAQVDNEEQTARCNALNIKPALHIEPVEDNTGVTVIVPPPKPKPAAPHAPKKRAPQKAASKGASNQPDKPVTVGKSSRPHNEGPKNKGSRMKKSNLLWILLILVAAAIAAVLYFTSGKHEEKPNVQKTVIEKTTVNEQNDKKEGAEKAKKEKAESSGLKKDADKKENSSNIL